MPVSFVTTSNKKNIPFRRKAGLPAAPVVQAVPGAALPVPAAAGAGAVPVVAARGAAGSNGLPLFFLINYQSLCPLIPPGITGSAQCAEC